MKGYFLEKIEPIILPNATARKKLKAERNRLYGMVCVSYPWLIMFRRTLLLLSLPAALLAQTPQVPAKAPGADLARKAWLPDVTKVEIPCSDGAKQPAMWFSPVSTGKKPLLVGLHTWSSTYASAGGDAIYAEWCIAQGWAFVHPHFRGPNMTPEAMGSERAVLDIVEAVAWAKQQTVVDESRVYLVGVSGGGHMSLLMAGRHPELWAGVSAWCGISDIAQWHVEHINAGKPDRYAQNIEAALGHAPAKNDPVAWNRSPLSCLAAAGDLPLDINHGLQDGWHGGSVPFTHSLRAYNAVVHEAKRLDQEGITAFYAARRLPDGWPQPVADPTYGEWPVVFRQISGNTRISIFEGGHMMVHQAALNWLARQRKGLPAVWDTSDFVKLDTGAAESGK